MAGRGHKGPRHARIALLLLLAFSAASCGTDGAPRFEATPEEAEALFGQCAFCHRETAVRLATHGGHHDVSLKCEACHADLLPGEFGPEHRAVPACRDCHERQKTHFDPAEGTDEECHVCHEPHGSGNLFLVREEIELPSGERASVVFGNLLGLRDESFASESRPGTGLCEVCHDETRFFRADGGGERHFLLACFPCHPHAEGFAPR